MVGSGISYLRLINKYCSSVCAHSSVGPIISCDDTKCPFHAIRNDKPDLTLYGHEQRSEFLKEAVAFIQENYLKFGEFDWSEFRKGFGKRPWNSSWWGSPLTGKLKALGWHRVNTAKKSSSITRKGGASFTWMHKNWFSSFNSEAA
jgi:hypothetical protein